MIAVGKGVYLYVSEPHRIVPGLKHVWIVVKKEAKHYWHGTKLLYADVNTAMGIMMDVFRGKNLTRRERRQLVRTAADVARLVPMSVFVLIPFMELLLPVALKLFPNMLPSTFEEQHKKEENLKRELVARCVPSSSNPVYLNCELPQFIVQIPVFWLKRTPPRLEMAEFLQDTMESMARKKILKQKEGGMDGDAMTDTATELANLMTKVRTGRRVHNDEILVVAKLFDDEITLDNIARPQLVSMAKYMGLPPFGSDTFLRFQLQNKLQTLKADDRNIEAEGIENLTRAELITALRDRGMRATGLTEAGYRRNLKQWLELSLHQNVPASLLIMSRAFNITERRQPLPEESLKEAIASIDSSLLTEVLVEAGVGDDQQKLELLNKQNELIEQEKVEEKAKEEAKKAKEEEKRLKKEAKEKKLLEEELEMSKRGKEMGKSVDERDSKPRDAVSAAAAAAATAAAKATAPVVEGPSATAEAAPAATDDKAEAKVATQAKVATVEEAEEDIAEEEEDPMAEVLEDLTEDLSVMASESAVDEEREMLAKLKAKQAAKAAELEADRKAAEEADKIKREMARAEEEAALAEMARLADQDKSMKAIHEAQQAELDAVEKAVKGVEAAVEIAEASPSDLEEAAKLEMLRKKEAELQKKEAERQQLAEAHLAELKAAAIVREENMSSTLKARNALASKVEEMLAKIETQIQQVDTEIGTKLQKLDLDKDGRITFEELESAIKTHLNMKLPQDEIEGLVNRFRDLAESDVPDFLRGLRKSVTVDDVKILAKEYKIRYEKERAKKKEEQAEMKKKREEHEAAVLAMAERAQRAADALAQAAERIKRENRAKFPEE